jgi:hypothetical protein
MIVIMPHCEERVGFDIKKKRVGLPERIMMEGGPDSSGLPLNRRGTGGTGVAKQRFLWILQQLKVVTGHKSGIKLRGGTGCSPHN